MSDTTEKKSVFVRDATGLVREAGAFSILQFNAQSVTGVSIISGGLLLLPLMTSGIGIGASILIGLVLAISVNLVYYVLSVTIPRSGGDYVYLSRLLNPALGVLAAGLMGIFVPLVLAATFGSSVWVTAGLSPLLTGIGQGGLASSITTPTALMIAGIISTVFFAALLIFFGNKGFFVLNNILYSIAIIGMIAGILAFLSVDHNTYVKLFDTFAAQYGTNSSSIVQTASAQGYTTPGSDLMPVMVASALMFTSFYWATQSSYLGGEIKHIRRTQLIGILGAAAMWGVLTIVAVVVAYYTVGPQLITSANQLDFFSPSMWKIPASSFFAMYASVAAQNPAVSTLISLSILFGYLTAMGWAFLIFSRVVFALSFDRFFPARFADVSEKYHTPTKALLFFAGLTIVLLIMLTNSSTALVLYTYGVAINVVAMLVFFLSSVALALMPYWHKDIYEAGCPIKRKVGGVPAVTILGIVSALLLAIYEYLVVSNPTFFGVTPLVLEIMGGSIVFFLALYFVVKAYRKSQGIDLGQVYREVPPE